MFIVGFVSRVLVSIRWRVPRFVAHNFTPSPHRQGQRHGHEVPQARVEHGIRVDQRDKRSRVRERVTYKGRELALVERRAFFISQFAAPLERRFGYVDAI